MCQFPPNQLKKSFYREIVFPGGPAHFPPVPSLLIPISPLRALRTAIPELAVRDSARSLPPKRNVMQSKGLAQQRRHDQRAGFSISQFLPEFCLQSSPLSALANALARGQACGNHNTDQGPVTGNQGPGPGTTGVGEKSTLSGKSYTSRDSPHTTGQC